MKTDNKRSIKRYCAGILTAGALLAMAIPVYADTTTTTRKGHNPVNQLETLVENGTISQSTYDSITSYTAENHPDQRTGFLSGAVSDGIIDQDTADKLVEYMQSRSEERKTANDGTAPAGNERSNMWDSLLSEGIITQDEYDAIVASMPERGEGSENR